jgi:hypothetical protein
MKREAIFGNKATDESLIRLLLPPAIAQGFSQASDACMPVDQLWD